MNTLDQTNTPVNSPSARTGRGRSADSVRSAAQTRPEFELPDPIAVTADTDYQHRLMLTMGELEAGRRRFAAPTDKRQLPAMVTLAVGWVTRLSDMLTAAFPPDTDSTAATAALAAAGQFVEAARTLGEQPAGWKSAFGLLSGGTTGSTAERLRLLADAPGVLELLLSALAVGFRLPEFAAGWVTAAATFTDELRRDLAWTRPAG
jgi:hypothetical protein